MFRTIAGMALLLMLIGLILLPSGCVRVGGNEPLVDVKWDRSPETPTYVEPYPDSDVGPYVEPYPQ